MTENATYAANYGDISLGNSVERDGLKENIMLLRELSEKLDRYFTMRTLGEFSGEVSVYDN